MALEPQEPGQAAPGIADPGPLSLALPQVSGRFDRPHGVTGSTGDVLLVAQPPVQIGELLLVEAGVATQPPGVQQGLLVLAYRLAVCAQLGCFPTRLPGVLDRLGSQVAKGGVVREPRCILASGRQLAMDSSVLEHASSGRHPTFDDATGDLVAKGDRAVHLAEQPSAERLVEVAETPVEERIDQVELGAGASQRHDLERRPAPGAQGLDPREDGVTALVRDAIEAAGQHLRHVEGVAEGQVVQVPGIHSAARRPIRGRDQLRDAGHGEGGDVEAAGARGRRGGPQGQLQSFADLHLLGPVGRQHERSACVHPPGAVQQQVKARLVGPVDVLDDDEVRTFVVGVPQRRHEVPEDLRPRGSRGPDVRRQRRKKLPQGRKRRGSRVAVAVGQREAGTTAHPLDEGAHEGRLADACLSTDPHEAAVAGGGVVEVGGEDGQLGVSLDERHGSS